MAISLAELEHAVDQHLAAVQQAEAAAREAADTAAALRSTTQDGIEQTAAREADRVADRVFDAGAQEAQSRASDAAARHDVPRPIPDATQRAVQQGADRLHETPPSAASTPDAPPSLAPSPPPTAAGRTPAPSAPGPSAPATAAPGPSAPRTTGGAPAAPNARPSSGADHTTTAPSPSAGHVPTAGPAAHPGAAAGAGGGHHGGDVGPGASASPGADLGVAANWFQGLEQSVEHLTNPQPPATPPSPAQQAVATARAVQGFVGSVMGALSVPGDMLNAGFANLTAPLAKVLPAFPAATMTMLYVGLPHTHNHPPSLIPPAPPVPLPSLGSVMLGTSVKVLINGMPAARCGDIGLAPTCCGFTPFFQIKTGSSNTFIGGNRAARMLDICQACTSADDRNSGAIAAGKVMGAIGAAARGIQKVQAAMGYAAIAMDAVEAAVEDDAAMGAAKGMAAAMAAAQMAADAAASALTKAMGKDPAGIPPRVIGAITAGHPNVLIGGFPMVNIPNPAEMLLKRLARYKRAPGGGRPKGNEKPCGTEAQPINLITGAFFDQFVDFEIDGSIPLVWRRYYDSRWIAEDGPFGWGYRHEYQFTLRHTLDGIVLVTNENDAVTFPALEAAGHTADRDGLRLRRLAEPGHFAVEETDRPTMLFHLGEHADAAPLWRLHLGDQWVEFAYEPGGYLVGLRDSSDRATNLQYDAHGHVVRITRWQPGVEQEWLMATYAYDAAGLLVAWQDAFGHTATYAYDAARRMVGRTDRRGYSFFNEYDDQGRCTREYGEDGLWDAHVRYFPDERCAVATYADGATTTVFYDENGVLTDVVEPSGGRTRFVLDDAGHIKEEIDPLGNVVPWVYDARGGNVGRLTPQGHLLPPLDVEPNPPDPLSYELPNTPVEWECGGLLAPRAAPPAMGPDGMAPEPTAADPDRLTRDVLGRIVEEVDEDGHARRWWYDAEGNVVQYQDRDGALFQYTYDSWNLLRQRIDPAGAVTTYDHSIRAEVSRITDPNGTVSEYVRDAWDRVVEIRRHGAVKERYTYDLADNLIEKTDAAGQRLLGFEILPGNLDGVRLLGPDGIAQRFEYDEAGRITLAVTDDLAVAFAYDASGRILKDHRDGVGVDHEFDDGRLAATRYLDRFRIGYEYRADGTLEITDPTGGVHRWRVDDDGAMVRELSNGTIERARYDAVGRCLQKTGTTRWHGRAPRWDDTYRYSAEGDLLAVQQLWGATEYAYDAAHKLRLETLPRGIRREYRHDAADNLLKQPGLDGVALLEGNRVAAANGETFEYDRRNSVVRRRGPVREVAYEYDALDQLVACTVDGEPWTARYDPLCRRVSKTWRAETTTYYWDDFRLAAEEHADGRLRLYVYVDTRALVPFLCVEYDDRRVDPRAGRCYHLFTNQIGAPVRVEDAHGAAVWRAQLDPYGVAHVAAGATFEMALRFPGHYFDAETGLHYNRFRYYDPVLGRFLQSDPSGVDGGINLYAYSPNPLVEVDLDGLAHKPKKPPKPKKDKKKPKKEGDGKEGGPPKPKPGQKRDKNGRLRNPDGTFASEPRQPGERHDRGSEYPHGNDPKVRAKVIEDHTVNGKVIDPETGKVIPKDQVTIEHKEKVVDHWNREGRNQSAEERKQFYNDPNNLTVKPKSENSSEGATCGKTYRQDTGPDYSS